MITIRIERDKNQAVKGFCAEGHANTAPHGQDIVCAGVSTLIQASVFGLERHLKRAITLQQADASFAVRLADAPDDQTQAILETMILGLTEIAKLNPKSVRILESRR
ncbi:MAG: Cysteine protease Prp [Firmicutes bacterium]|nr:Cysteine protease Prp [Bacillota bacterium]